MKDNLSQFIKTAYKYNRVKDLKDAFEDYPVESEWHKGKIENIIKIKKKLKKGVENGIICS